SRMEVERTTICITATAVGLFGVIKERPMYYRSEALGGEGLISLNR
ncbi:hypothetical protein MRX96_050406, partial [Rhipicephalus microplus]